jgi:hypothetical protein
LVQYEKKRTRILRAGKRSSKTSAGAGNVRDSGVFRAGGMAATDFGTKADWISTARAQEMQKNSRWLAADG